MSTMSNLKRHFIFSTKNDASLGNSAPTQFDKLNHMNNISSCLEICCSYIQALNSLCDAGALLADSLLQAVQNVPAYQSVAQQFLCVWDEVGKATAGASAKVKTETLMRLQEVLNSLEMGSSESAIDMSVTESFQVIGSCLFSFVELQAQFSLSTWKSLSKLSKHLTNDAFLHTLHWKSHDRNTFKISKNSDLSTAIKKHFSQLVHKYEQQKACDLSEPQHSQFYINPAMQSNSVNTQSVSQVEPPKFPNTTVWSPTSTTLWSTSVENAKCDEKSQGPYPKISNVVPSCNDTSGLDEVINLLSIMPISQFPTNTSQPPSDQKSYERLPPSSYQFWPSGSAPVLSRNVNSQRTWSDGSRGINFGYDPWIWRPDNMNCSALALPNGVSQTNQPSAKDSNRTSPWEKAEYQRWSIGTGENGSSSDDMSSSHGQDIDSIVASQVLNQDFFAANRLRRYSSSDGLPDLQDVPEADEHLWNSQTHKTSTWPLKQTSSRLVSDWPDLSDSKHMPLYYTPPS